MERGKRFYAVGISVLFLLLISFPLFNEALQFSKEKTVSKNEKRTLAKKPFFNLAKLDPYPVSYNIYYEDHFPFRSEMIQNYTYFIYKAFGKSNKPSYCVIGKQGWLYLTMNEKPVFTGKMTLKPSEIDSIVQGLEKRARWLAGKGIKFYVTFAPMKAEIYPEYLPAGYTRVKKGTITDKIIKALKDEPFVNFIELKPALLKAKKNDRLYNITDNHWNAKGAFVAYREIIERIKKDFPKTGYPTKTDVTFKDTVIQGGNLAAMLDLAEYLPETDYFPVIKNARARFGKTAGYKFPQLFDGYYEIVKETGDTSLPRALVIRDSFGGAIMPFLDENFSKTVYIFDAWTYGYNREIVENEKPSLVLLIIYEPHIHNLLEAR